MKKKIFVLLIIVLIALITLAIFLMLPKDKDNSSALAFKNEYEALNGKMARYKKPHRTLNISEDNPYVKTTPKKIVEMLENKESFYLYVGDPLCPWCRSVVEQSIKSAKENGIDTIYYIDFWDDNNNEILRDVYELVDGEIKQTHKATDEYTRMLELCSDSIGLRNYTVEDENGKEVEVNSKRFFGPTFLYAEGGRFKKYTDARSSLQKSPLEELTDEIKKDQAEKFDELFLEICDDAC